MFGVWPTLLILILMLLMGLVTLGHGATVRHPRRHLCTLITVSIVCIVGIIHVLQYVAFLTLRSVDPNEELLKARLQCDFTSIDIVVLSFLWRCCALTTLNTVQTMQAFVYFVLIATGRVTMKLLFPSNRALGVVPNSMFTNVLMKAFLCRLSVEYLMFYLPAFITMYMLYRKRSAKSPSETGVVNVPEDTVHEMTFGRAEDECVKCETMSPLLDMVAACMALMLLLVRPLYALSCYLVYGIPMDLNTTFCVFPFYFAVCFVNFSIMQNRSHNPHISVPPVHSWEVPSIHVK